MIFYVVKLIVTTLVAIQWKQTLDLIRGSSFHNPVNLLC